MADAIPEEAAAATEDSGSLAEHESEFAKGAQPTPNTAPPDAAETDADASRDANGRFVKPTRHRANSQKAGADDVAAIAEYTKRLREAEDAAGIEKKPGESQRVYELRRRAELAEARRDARRLPTAGSATPVTTSAPPPRPPAAAQSSQPATFTDPEPTFESFSAANPSHQDPYAGFLRALAAWDRRKDAFDSQQAQAKQQTEQQQTERQQQFQKWVQERTQEHDARMDSYITANPDALTDLKAAADFEITPVMFAAIQLHEQGPAMMRALAKNPALADEFYFLTDGKLVGDPYNNPLVAKVQRRLLQHVQAAQTGSAAVSRPLAPASRPPNPVRTTPQTPSDGVPGDDAPLSAHEKAFHGSRRR